MSSNNRLQEAEERICGLNKLIKEPPDSITEDALMEELVLIADFLLKELNNRIKQQKLQSRLKRSKL